LAKRARPRRAPSPETAARARNAPTNTDTGSWYLSTSEAVSNCDRSPHSARKMMPKHKVTMCQPLTCRFAFAPNSSSVSRSSSSAPLAPLRSRTPPTRNMRVANTSTGVRGSRVSSPPTATATAVCTRNAAVTPIQTSSGRNRVDMTKVAMNVLSGSSMRKMRPKTTATVMRSGTATKYAACSPAPVATGCRRPPRYR